MIKPWQGHVPTVVQHHAQASALERPLSKQPEVDQPQHVIIGQLFKTYILVQNQDELVMVDQHAAHERVLYERYKNNFDVAPGTLLLFPEVVTLTNDLVAGLMPWQAYFARQGIEFDALGSREIVLRTSPPQLRFSQMPSRYT